MSIFPISHNQPSQTPPPASNKRKEPTSAPPTRVSSRIANLAASKLTSTSSKKVRTATPLVPTVSPFPNPTSSIPQHLLPTPQQLPTSQPQQPPISQPQQPPTPQPPPTPTPQPPPTPAPAPTQPPQQHHHQFQPQHQFQQPPQSPQQLPTSQPQQPPTSQPQQLFTQQQQLLFTQQQQQQQQLQLQRQQQQSRFRELPSITPSLLIPETDHRDLLDQAITAFQTNATVTNYNNETVCNNSDKKGVISIYGKNQKATDLLLSTLIYRLQVELKKVFVELTSNPTEFEKRDLCSRFKPENTILMRKEGMQISDDIRKKFNSIILCPEDKTSYDKGYSQYYGAVIDSDQITTNEIIAIYANKIKQSLVSHQIAVTDKDLEKIQFLLDPPENHDLENHLIAHCRRNNKEQLDKEAFTESFKNYMPNNSEKLNAFISRFYPSPPITSPSPKEALSQKIAGQPLAIKAVHRKIVTYKQGMKDPNRPPAVFLFVGPPGVGKTELAKEMSHFLFGRATVNRINMAEFAERHRISELRGSPLGYVGSDKPSLLETFLKDNPKTLILLDEVEKAHPEVLKYFLSIFDEGTSTLNKGTQLDFRNTFFVATSNFHHEILKEEQKNDPKALDAALQEIKEAFSQKLGPEWINRVEIVPFFPLHGEDYEKIASVHLEKLKQEFSEKHKIPLTISPAVIQWLAAFARNKGEGTRPLLQKINDTIRYKIAKLKQSNQIPEGPLLVDLKDEKIIISSQNNANNNKEEETVTT